MMQGYTTGFLRQTLLVEDWPGSRGSQIVSEYIFCDGA
jgi:hypothetical protein